MLLEAPRFWTWAHIEMNNENFEEIFQSERFQNVSKFSLLGVDGEKLTSFYSELLNYKPFNGFLDISQRDLSRVSTELLTKLFTVINWVFMKKITLTEEQISQIFHSIEQSEKLKLNCLYSISTSLSAVSPSSLARAAVRLKKLELYEAGLTSAQAAALFSLLVERAECGLEYLELGHNNLSEVPAEVLASAVVRVQEVKLSHCSLTFAQSEAILLRIAEAGAVTRLSVLDLHGNNLATVPPATISAALLRLAQVEVHMTELTSEQVVAIFQRIASQDSPELKLKKLVIWSNDLSTVPSESLSKASVKLEEVSLFLTRLTRDQVNALLTRIVETDDLKLRSLDVCDNDLSSVPRSVLVEVVRKMQEINLYHTLLTQDQLEGVIQTIAQSEGDQLKLNKIDLRYNNFSSISSDTLSRSSVRLEKISLENSQLSQEQIIAILTRITDCIDGDLKLKHLEIGKNDLSKVPTDLLVQSVIKLEDVSLRESQLTSEQIDTIFKTIAERKELQLKSLDVRLNDLSCLSSSVLQTVKSRVTWLYLTADISPECHRIIYRKSRPQTTENSFR